MKLQLLTRGFELTPAIQEHLERRRAFALGRFGQEISGIWARVADTNGPRGGIDKLVAVRVEGRRIGTLLVSDTDFDLYTAIDRATDRLGRTVARVLERKRQRRMPRRD
jgi:putative sigma-54 modulation protein